VFAFDIAFVTIKSKHKVLRRKARLSMTRFLNYDRQYRCRGRLKCHAILARDFVRRTLYLLLARDESNRICHEQLAPLMYTFPFQFSQLIESKAAAPPH
jgi:hypothetical protein